MPSNDNDPHASGDAQHTSYAPGQAALLLVESLIHGLCENDTISSEEAIEIIDRAVSVQAEHADAADGAGAPLWRSHALLVQIAASLRSHDGEPPMPPSIA